MSILKIKNNLHIVLLMITSTIMLFFISATSPIRDINYLNYDSTTFYIIGKGIKYGYVPYKDLTDHKGIYIYLFNYLATLISETNHLGLFIMHLLLSYFTLYVLYKIAEFFTKNKIVCVYVSFTMLVLQNIYFFSDGGIKCETFLAPFLYLTIYLFLLNDWGKSFFSKNMFLIGINAGVILLTKANSLLLFVPIIIYLTYVLIPSKKIIKLIGLFFSGLLGIIIGILPGMVYCIINDCLKEMIHYSFALNLLYSENLFYFYKSYSEAVADILYGFMPLILLSIFSIYAFYKLSYNKKLMIYYISHVFFSIIASFMALKPFTYHANPLLTNILYLVIYLFCLLDKYIIKKRKIYKALYLIITIALFVVSHFSWIDTEHYYQKGYKSAKIVHTIYNELYGTDRKKVPVLVIGTFLSAYNELDILPNIKHFCTPYMNNSRYSEPYDEILENLKLKKSEFVILTLTSNMIKDGFNQKVRDVLKENYDFVKDDRNIEVYKLHK